ncbi:MAG: hypothetical protein ABMB14_08785, partial [Myxococcota bacterium]
MTAKLDNLGVARVFRHARTGELVVDTDSLRRPGRISGMGFGANPYDDDDDDDDDFDDGDLDDYDDEFEGDEVGDLEGDDFGDLEGDIEGDDFGDGLGNDFGAEGRRRRRHLRRKLSRLNRRESRTRSKLRRNRRKHGITRRKKVNWGMTAVSGTDTLTVAGAASVKVRLQHDFRATDITFTGSAPGAKVTSIFFGDRSVWSSSEGIDVTVFGSTSFLRG